MLLVLIILYINNRFPASANAFTALNAFLTRSARHVLSML